MYGVDFGTTNSSICVWRTGRPRPDEILLTQNQPFESTVVFLEPGGGRVAGDRAETVYQQSVRPDGKFVRLFKPLLVTPAWGSVRWRLLESDPVLIHDKRTEDCMIRINEDRWALEGTTKEGTVPFFTPDEIDMSAIEVLRHLKAHADLATGEPQEDGVIIGVPVHFSPTGRSRLRGAAVRAGLAKRLQDVHVLLEPLAMVFQYAVAGGDPRRVLVFDFGGGTLDLSVVDLIPKGRSHKYVVRLHDNLPVGGADLDRALFDHLVDARLGNAVNDLRHDSPGWVRLMKDVRLLKEQLSTRSRVETAIVVGLGKAITCSVTRDAFEKAIGDDLTKIRDKLLDIGGRLDGGLASLDRVLMSGGSSLVPAVMRLIRQACPNSQVDDRFAGPGKAAMGYGLARDEMAKVEDMNDTDYCLWNYSNHNLETFVRADIPLGSDKGQNGALVTLDGYGTDLLVFSKDDAIPVPMCKVRVPEGPTGLEVIGNVDPMTRELAVRVLDSDSGCELEVDQEPWTGGATDPPFVVWKGQLLRMPRRLFGPKRHGVVTNVFPFWGCPREVAVMNSEKAHVRVRTGDSHEIVVDSGGAEVFRQVPRIGEILDVDRMPDSSFGQFRWSSVGHQYEVLAQDPVVPEEAAFKEVATGTTGQALTALEIPAENESIDIDETVQWLTGEWESLLRSLPEQVRQSIEIAFEVEDMKRKITAAFIFVEDADSRQRLFKMLRSVNSILDCMVRDAL